MGPVGQTWGAPEGPVARAGAWWAVGAWALGGSWGLWSSQLWGHQPWCWNHKHPTRPEARRALGSVSPGSRGLRQNLPEYTRESLCLTWMWKQSG